MMNAACCERSRGVYVRFVESVEFSSPRCVAALKRNNEIAIGHCCEMEFALEILCCWGRCARQKRASG